MCGTQLAVVPAYSPWALLQRSLGLVLNEHSTCLAEAEAVIKDLHGQQNAHVSYYYKNP